MKIETSGRGIKIGSNLINYVEEKLPHTVEKYFEHAISGNVIFSKDAFLYRADILVNEGTGTRDLIRAHAESDDIYNAFFNALVKIEKQLRRYKSKIKDHHHKKKLTDLAMDGTLLKAKKYVISKEDYSEEEVNEDNPIIIAEKFAEIEELTVSDAVMNMNLLSLPALLFINKASGRMNLVYHRDDGNISWVDPEV